MMPLIDEIRQTLQTRCPGALIAADPDAPIPVLQIDREQVTSAFFVLRDAFDFESLMCETASDKMDRIVMVYHLYSTKRQQKLVVKTELSRGLPAVESAEEVWKAANWYEREIYDLFGVEFIGHSDMIRILLPEDWVGHPLRKDYMPAAEYHGMKIEGAPNTEQE